jgi:ATP phosphoribosyltransferase
MGIADAILDLVSSGTTLRENNLKEIEGGVVLKSQVRYLGPCQASDFVASKNAIKT